MQLGPCTEGYIVSLRAGIREPLTPSLTWLEPLTLTLTLSHTVTRSLPLTLTLRAATRLYTRSLPEAWASGFCADQQLNDPRWQELAGVRAVRATQRVPWVSLAPTNFGDISRTPCISRSDHQLLRWLGRGDRRPHGLRVNATALALAPAQRKRGYCRSFDNVTRSR